MGGIAALLVGVLLTMLVPGYLVWLRRGRRPGARTGSPAPSSWPRVDIILPVRNEVHWIEEKLQNLSELRYPGTQLQIWVVDGASSDGTADVASATIRNDPRFELLRLGVSDKTVQLNAALRRIRGDWVMVTDADARLAPDTLRTMVSAGEALELAVVGTSVDPVRAHPLEELHYRINNRLRLDESLRGCASIVTGPCYLFRRGLLRSFPTDVVADDVHVAFVAATARRRVGFVDTRVTELRSPWCLRELFWHKMRKADAYLREVFRFLPRVGEMSSPGREIFLWRAAHLTLVPVLAAAGALGLLGWLASAGISLDVSLATAGGAIGATWLGRRSVPCLMQGIALGAVLTVVLLGALAAYPFSQQTACLPKVATTGNRARRRGAQ